MRSALVTGASRGIGRGIAEALASQGYGLTVTSRDHADLERLAKELRSAGSPDVRHCALDLADRSGLPGLVECHAAAFGTMDALVLSGGVGTAGAIGEASERRLDKTLQVNFVSTMLVIQQALPLLRKAARADPAHGARVIALSSITGVYAEPGLAAYGASKAAVISLIETLNAEESAQGVLGTAIAPAYVDTDMSAWTTDRVPAETMIPVRDVVAVVRMLLDLGSTTSISKVILARSGTTGYVA